MNAKIDRLTPAEQEWIGQQLKDAKAFVQQVLSKESEDLPSANDLDRAFNTWMHSPTHDSSQANAVINFIGIAFGQHLAKTTPLEWVIASDDYGTELALYAFPGEGDVLVYPQNFVAKRYETAEGTFIVESLDKIRQDVRNVQDAKQQKECGNDRDVKIRRASREDAGLLAELGARTFSETFAADNTPQDMSVYLAASFSLAQQTVELADPASTFLLAEVGGLATGYAKLHGGEAAEGVEAAKPVELVRLYVSFEWLGRGIGKALMRACVDEARQAGHDAIWLGVWERNGRAQAFYRKWNFRAVGEHVFQLGSDPQRDILMQRAV